MTPHRLIAVVLAGALLVSLAGGPVVAQDDLDGTVAEIVAPDDYGPAEAFLDGVRGFGGSAGLWLNRQLDSVPVVGGDPPDPDAEAADIRSFINDNNASLEAHTNDVLDEYDATVYNTTAVLEVTITSEAASDETFYVIAEADGENVTNVTAVTSTSKTVDRSEELDVYEAEALNEDLRAYHEEYVEEDEVPPVGYYVRTASKYGDISELEVRSTIDNNTN